MKVDELAVAEGATWRVAKVNYNGVWWRHPAYVAESLVQPGQFIARWSSSQGGVTFSGPHTAEEVRPLDVDVPEETVAGRGRFSGFSPVVGVLLSLGCARRRNRRFSSS